MMEDYVQTITVPDATEYKIGDTLIIPQRCRCFIHRLLSRWFIPKPWPYTITNISRDDVG